MTTDRRHTLPASSPPAARHTLFLRGVGACLIAGAAALCGGCMDRIELNRLAIVDMLGLDLSENGELFVSAQFILPGEFAGSSMRPSPSSQGDPVYTLSATGLTAPDALAKIQRTLPRRLFLGHIRAIVLGERLARAGIGLAIEFVGRMPQIRKSVSLFVANGRAYDLLQVRPRYARVPAEALEGLLRADALEEFSMADFTLALVEEGRDPVLPLIAAYRRPDAAAAPREDRPPGESFEFQIAGLAIFRGDKYVGALRGLDAEIGGWLVGAGARARLTIGVPVADEQAPAEAGSQDRSTGSASAEHVVTISFRRPRAHFNVRTGPSGPVTEVVLSSAATIETVRAPLALGQAAAIEQLRTLANEALRERITRVVTIATRELRADIFGLGAALHRSDPEAWHALEERWYEVLPRVQIHIVARAALRASGIANSPIVVPTDQLRRLGGSR
ncbi:MAG TPA: Ger(x)C family spore germination protein [Limnochordia bacterium]